MTNIIILISGGIDSFFISMLLYTKKLKILGVYMQNWEDYGLLQCSQEIDIFNSINISQRFSIILILFNFFSKYWDLVFRFFLKFFKYGYILNPDSFCNKKIKFGTLISYFISNKQFFISGHYSILKKNKEYYCFLMRSFDFKKDQTYFLSFTSINILFRSIFFLGKFLKKEIKKIILQYIFYLYIRKESMGICFIGNKNFISFISSYTHTPISLSIRQENMIFIGEKFHLIFLSVGKKQGLILNKTKTKTCWLLPWFTNFNSINKNIITILQGEKHIMFLESKIIVVVIFYSKIFYNSSVIINIIFQCIQQKIFLCINYFFIFVRFFNKNKKITRGQFITFYKNLICIGSSFIL